MGSYWSVLNMLSALVFCSILPSPVWAQGQVKSCSKKSLELQDCHLKIGAFPVHIRSDKIILRGPVQREMKSFQLQEFVEWDLVRGRLINNRAFLELVLWSKPVGEVEVSSAMYYIYEIKSGEVQPRLEKLIQKRKKIETKEKYEKDRRLAATVFAKSRKTYWRVGDESGEL